MTLFVYTSEVYPTRLRGTAFGVFGMDGYTGRLSSTFSALVSMCSLLTVFRPLTRVSNLFFEITIILSPNSIMQP